MSVLEVPLRNQVYDLETQIANNTTAAAPLTVDLILGAPIITGLYFYCDNSAALAAAYWRVLHQGNVIFPGGTAQPINTAVPGGWLAMPKAMFYPVLLQLPQGPSYRVQVQFINLSGAAINAEVVFITAFVTPDQLLIALIEKIDGLTQGLKGQ